MDAAQPGVAAPRDGPQPGQAAERGDFFEDEHVEESVGWVGFREDRERSAVEASEADENPWGLDGWKAFGADLEFAAGLTEHVDSGGDVGEGSPSAFRRGIDGGDGVSIEAHAGQLDERGLVGHTQIEGEGSRGTQSQQSLFPVEGEIEFAGEDVGCAEGQDAEFGVGAGEAAYDLVDGAIAPGGHDGFEAGVGGFAGECFGVAGFLGDPDGRVGGELGEAFVDVGEASPSSEGV